MSSAGSTNDSEQLVRSLLAGTGIAHRCDNPKLIETHISWLVMLGDFVYKIKKPLDLGFLDFSTLAKRRRFCEEELRLNRRTAPTQYVEVLPVSGTPEAPRPGDASAPFEYAVKMRRFDDRTLLNKLADQNKLTASMIDALAHSIAAFHKAIAGVPMPGHAGTPASAYRSATDNFTTLAELDHDADDLRMLQQISAWAEDEFLRIKSIIAARREAGFVRECHGDLHLENIYWDNRAVLFDAIEFSESLRWIDVASDIAFTLMDLANHAHPELANRLLNEYLLHTGDFESLGVLRYYLVYRAMVRAKVSAIRANQNKLHANNLHRDLTHYLRLASGYCAPDRPRLVMMCGLSGTGKTTVAREVAAASGFIHLRSDVERKRLFGLAPEASSRDSGMDIYTAQASERTFARLEALASDCLKQGFGVVVDATFIGRSRRRQFANLAKQQGVPWRIIQTTAPEAVVIARLGLRHGDASEAGIEQYQSQQDHFDPFSAAEKSRLEVIDTSVAEPDAINR